MTHDAQNVHQRASPLDQHSALSQVHSSYLSLCMHEIYPPSLGRSSSKNLAMSPSLCGALQRDVVMHTGCMLSSHSNVLQCTISKNALLPQKFSLGLQYNPFTWSQHFLDKSLRVISSGGVVIARVVLSGRMARGLGAGLPSSPQGSSDQTSEARGETFHLSKMSFLLSCFTSRTQSFQTLSQITSQGPLAYCHRMMDKSVSWVKL